LLYELRRAGIPTDCDYLAKSLKAQMRYADKLGARFVLILGDEELRENVVTVRDMKRSEQWREKIDEVASSLKALMADSF
jgi:histidyl-tRNA synthetase